MKEKITLIDLAIKSFVPLKKGKFKQVTFFLNYNINARFNMIDSVSVSPLDKNYNEIADWTILHKHYLINNVDENQSFDKSSMILFINDNLHGRLENKIKKLLKNNKRVFVYNKINALLKEIECIL